MSTKSLKSEPSTQVSRGRLDTRKSHYGSDENLRKRLAGSYFLWEGAHNDDQIFFRLVTLMADGTWNSSHAHQQSKDFAFTIQQGVWEAIGPREVSARGMDFNYNPVGGDPHGVSKIGFVMEWSEDYQAVRGNIYGERFRLDQNPFNPDEISKANFGNGFTGRRLRVR